jgi:4-hydroxy-4-methyl-2-oxoglutarate aldolase
VAAIVTDGLLRDAVGIVKVGIPAFSRGLSPHSGFQNGPGEINLPIAIGGLSVEPGDIVLGDRDGVVVIPRARAEEVAASLDRVRKAEHEAEEKVAAGKLKQLWKPEKFEQRGVRYLD